MPKIVDQKMLIIGGGLVGVGKTTHLRKLSERIANSIYIDKDTINLVLLNKVTADLPRVKAEEYSSSNYRENVKSQTYNIMLKVAEDNLKCNKVVILDGYFGNKLIDSFLNGYLSSPNFITKVIYFHCSGSVEFSRLCKRGYKRDEERLEKFSSFRYSDVRNHLTGFSKIPHLVVDTEKNLEENLEKIYQYLTTPEATPSFIVSSLPKKEALLTEETAMLGVEGLSKLFSEEHQNLNTLRLRSRL